MKRRLERPQNPEVLGRLIAALRVYSGQRQPKNATERKINDALKAQKVPPTAAKRLVATLDSTPKGARTKLLGKIAEPKFAPPARAPALTAAPPTVTVPTAAVGALGRRPGDGRVDVHDRLGDGPRAKPVYTIRYNGLWCEDESSWDRFSLADEIYVVTTAVHIDANGQNIVRTEMHPVGQSFYGDVDSDEVRLGPVAACWQGDSDPVSLTVVVFEHDEGDPNAYKKEVDWLVKAGIAVLIGYYGPLAALELLSPLISDAINWLLDTGDDPIESKTVVNPRAMLDWYAAHYTSPYYSGQRDTGLWFHFTTIHNGGGARYVSGFEVTREPPLQKEVVIV